MKLKAAIYLIIVMFMPRMASALIVGPYTPDANTLFLFHFDETAGGSATTNAGSLGLNAYTVANATSGGGGFAKPPAIAALEVNTTDEAVSDLPNAANIGW